MDDELFVINNLFILFNLAHVVCQYIVVSFIIICVVLFFGLCVVHCLSYKFIIFFHLFGRIYSL